MQPVLERGSIDKPLTFDVGLIQLSFIYTSVFSNISVKLREGLHFIMPGLNGHGLQSKLLITPLSQ